MILRAGWGVGAGFEIGFMRNSNSNIIVIVIIIVTITNSENYDSIVIVTIVIVIIVIVIIIIGLRDRLYAAMGREKFLAFACSRLGQLLLSFVFEGLR